MVWELIHLLIFKHEILLGRSRRQQPREDSKHLTVSSDLW